MKVTSVKTSELAVHLPKMSEGQSVTIRNAGSEPLTVYGVAASLSASPCVTDGPDGPRFRGITILIEEQFLTTPSVELPAERPLTIEEMVHDLWDVAKGAAYPSSGYAVPKTFWDRAIGYLTEIRHRTEEPFRRETGLTIHNWRYAVNAATIDTTEAGIVAHDWRYVERSVPLSVEAQGLVESFQAAPTDADLEEACQNIARFQAETQANPLATFCGERFRRPDEIAQMDETARAAVAQDIARHRHDEDQAAGLVPLPQKPQPEEKPYIPQKWGKHG